MSTWSKYLKGKRKALVAVSLTCALVACESTHLPTSPTPQVLTPSVPTASCAPFDILLRIDRNIGNQTATLTADGIVRFDVLNVSSQKSPAVYTLALDRSYEVRGLNSHGCWSRPQVFLMVANPVGREPAPAPQPCDIDSRTGACQ